MHIEFRKAIQPAETRSLVTFDRKVFRASDRFYPSDWQSYEAWWMLLGRRRIGCCALEPHIDLQEDIRDDFANPPLAGSLYIGSTGILPAFQGQGFGTLMKAWQVAYARHHGYRRIVTNTRQQNRAMLALNRKFGFREIRCTPNYYQDPDDATVVMELRLSPDAVDSR